MVHFLPLVGCFREPTGTLEAATETLLQCKRSRQCVILETSDQPFSTASAVKVL